MSRSARKDNTKDNYHLYEDRFFGWLIFYYYNGGRKVIALVVLAYAIPAVFLMFKCYLSGQTWFDLWNMYLWALGTPYITFSFTFLHFANVLDGRIRLGSDAVLLHVLCELNDRCSKNSVINWRAIAHSANKFSEELGESPMVFYGGFHCMHHFCYQAVDVIIQGGPLFEDGSREVSERQNDIAESAVRKYRARIESFSDQSDRYSMPVAGFLERLQERLRIKEVQSH